ncbi:kinase-like domain-containing protein [Lophiotrema nucula]|uniref:Kinase-like domain-containing protein n=1 Tax=Lophiotrema nucula TaxID=690887 RepID=A0A6A5YUW5_9PLEO|nr:kinase-like domain-containing protein [Lophiotrema nucula]
MTNLYDLRRRIQSLKIPAAGQKSRFFVPNGALDSLLTLDTVQGVLAERSFSVPPHKIQNTAQTIVDEAKKIFAILIDTKAEGSLGQFIESDTLDKCLPVEVTLLQKLLPEADVQEVLLRQWEYMAYNFRRGPYQRQVRTEVVLPYLEQTKIGSGGFSTVYEIMVHTSHQNFESDVERIGRSGIRMVRKKLTAITSNSTAKDEAELLFLLCSQRHDNVVELITSYSQDNFTNLIFERADMDLHEFLLAEKRVPGFVENRTIFNAILGLARGLEYIHGFKVMEGMDKKNASTYMFGSHQDIKPRNVLVRKTKFVLADFGLMRLKTSVEDSKTLWKNGTVEYGAPECRDPDTLEQRHIGRASDIWSLGCVLAEVMVYMQEGHGGLEEFRKSRVSNGTYGKISRFHDEVGPSPVMLEHLARVATGTEKKPDWRPELGLFSQIQDMFNVAPTERPTATKVVEGLSKVTLEAILKDLLEKTATYLEKTPRNTTNVFRVRLKLEENRLRAWAAIMGLSPPLWHLEPPDLQDANPVPLIWVNLETTIEDLNIRDPFEEARLNEEYIIQKLHQANNKLYDILPSTDRDSADRVFATLSTTNTKKETLLSIGQVAQNESFPYRDIGAIAAMKYMSILLSRETITDDRIPRIDASLIDPDSSMPEDEVHPEIFWYSYGYRADERERVLVEWKGYGGKWQKDPDAEGFRERGLAMFSRIQGLVAMLRHAKPPHFRVLECSGCFHNVQQRKFGIVYKFPAADVIPLRLHHILRGRDQPAKVNFHVGEKIALAKALAVSLWTLHMSGWMHKDINSNNIVFFTESTQHYRLQASEPYLIGFQHSRQEDTYTEGPEISESWSKYQHPKYQTGSEPFRKEYDYYSFGLVLLEIAGWERLSNVYSRWKGDTPLQLRERYLKICDDKILERMGPTYHAVTRGCLLAETQFSGKELKSTIDFQRDVVERLNTCRI